ncbi:MAG: hypothetical protein JWR75_1762 [Devosia sp.]|nr:hypothetical protein [Devosia sp.]
MANVQTTLEVHVPLTISRRGGRKLVISPDGDGLDRSATPTVPRVDDALVKAIARAHRWKRMLESGEFATVTELAKHERIARSYLTRVLRLTLLAPAIVESVLDGTEIFFTLPQVLKPFTGTWTDQSPNKTFEQPKGAPTKNRITISNCAPSSHRPSSP